MKIVGLCEICVFNRKIGNVQFCKEAQISRIHSNTVVSERSVVKTISTWPGDFRHSKDGQEFRCIKCNFFVTKDEDGK